MVDMTRAAVADVGRYFDSWLEFRCRFERVPGVQAALLHDDVIVMSSAHGVSSLDRGDAMTERHLFRIASHSKTFTATAVMQLVERGLVRLDDTVGHWIPELASSAISTVTLRELLSHSSGLVRDGWDGDFWQLFRAFPDRDELLQIATDRADVLPRNERFKYSNIGFSIAGLVIEAASGQPYNAYVSEHIVDRLGLLDTAPELDPTRADDYAGGHSARSYADERMAIDHVDTGAMPAATGFSSTASDLVRYVSAHFDGDDRLLGAETKRQMQHAAWDVAGGDTSYGLGFAISSIGERRVLGHGGGYPGHITRTFFDPTGRLAVSVLTNAIDGPALGWATAAFRLLDLATDHAPDDQHDATDGIDRSGFCGRFANLWGVFDVVQLGGSLFRIDPTQADPGLAPARLEVLDESRLRIADDTGYGSYGERLEYEFAPDGSVVSVRGGSANSSYPLEAFRAATVRRVRVGEPIRP